MDYSICACTDVGIQKKINQDSLSVKLLSTCFGNMVFAVLCDGVGGLDKGEVVSATVVKAFNDWLINDFANKLKYPIEDWDIKYDWEKIIGIQNEKILEYGRNHSVSLGTTIVVMLITEERYFILNVGDSRAYEIRDKATQLTNDHSFIAREVAAGNMTQEQADKDPRGNLLLQCIGAVNEVNPEMYFGKTQKNTIYMLCSDGFTKKISNEEMQRMLNPELLINEAEMERKAKEIIEIIKFREEKDNISVVLIKSF